MAGKVFHNILMSASTTLTAFKPELFWMFTSIHARLDTPYRTDHHCEEPTREQWCRHRPYAMRGTPPRVDDHSKQSPSERCGHNYVDCSQLLHTRQDAPHTVDYRRKQPISKHNDGRPTTPEIVKRGRSEKRHRHSLVNGTTNLKRTSLIDYFHRSKDLQSSTRNSIETPLFSQQMHPSQLYFHSIRILFRCNWLVTSITQECSFDAVAKEFYMFVLLSW